MNEMPFGQIAAKASGAPANLLPPMPPPGMPPAPSTPPSVLPPAASPAPIGPPPMSPAVGLPMMPPPSAPATPPYSVRLQNDGSAVFYVASPDGDPGKDVVLQVAKAPKVPPAFQTSAPQGPAV